MSTYDTAKSKIRHRSPDGLVEFSEKMGVKSCDTVPLNTGKLSGGSSCLQSRPVLIVLELAPLT